MPKEIPEIDWKSFEEKIGDVKIVEALKSRFLALCPKKEKVPTATLDNIAREESQYKEKLKHIDSEYEHIIKITDTAVLFRFQNAFEFSF